MKKEMSYLTFYLQFKVYKAAKSSIITILFHQAMIPPLKEQRQQCEKTFSHDAHFVLSERELTEEDELTICSGGRRRRR